MTNRMTECGNCGHRCTEEQVAKSLFEVDDLPERLTEGDEVPVGECGRCEEHALVYLVCGTYAQDKKAPWEILKNRQRFLCLSRPEGGATEDEFYRAVALLVHALNTKEAQQS